MKINFLKTISFNLVSRIKQVPWLLAEKIFLVIFFLFLFSLFLDWTLFYYYILIPQKMVIKVEKSPFSFKEDVYKQVLIQQEILQRKVEQFSQKEYINPFAKLRD